MAQKKIPDFVIRPTVPQKALNGQGKVALDNQRSAQVDFEVEYQGGDALPVVGAKLVTTVERKWYQFLSFWRRGVDEADLPAGSSWLDVAGLPLNDSLASTSKSANKSAKLTVFINVPVDVDAGDYSFRLAVVDERQRTLAQSDPIKIQVNSQPFSIKVLEPKTRRFTLFPNRERVCKFEVENTSGAPAQGRVRLASRSSDRPGRLFRQPERATDVQWLQIDSLEEQAYPADTDNNKLPYSVTLKASSHTLPGLYQFSLDVADANNPDEIFNQGPVVMFRILAFPWALVIALAVVLLLSASIWALRLPHLEVKTNLGNSIAQRGPNSVLLTEQNPPTAPATLPGQKTQASQTQEVTAGKEFTYTLTVTSTSGLLGRWDASGRGGIVLEDQWEDKITFVQGEGCEGAGNIITCTVPENEPISPGDPYVFTVTARTDPAQTGVLTHTLALETHIPGMGSAPLETYSVTVKTEDGLKLGWVRLEGEQTPPDQKDDVQQDEWVTYVLTVTNRGPSQSTQTTLKFDPQLPPMFMALSVRSDTCNTDRDNQWVQCQWETLAPQESQVVTITLIPGPTISGIIPITVTLTATGNDPEVTQIPLTVTAAHGLTVNLTAGKPGVEIAPGDPLTYTVVVTNSMPFSATDLQVDFRIPDLIGKSVTLGDIEPRTKCWINIKPGNDNNTVGDQEYWVHCSFDELQANAVQTIRVTTHPPQEGKYDGYVQAASLGFQAMDSVSPYVASEQTTTALRLDGSAFLTVALSDTAPLTSDFQAEVKFYYDGSGEGRILGIGDRETEDGWIPGWSIGVQGGILTMRVRDNDNNLLIKRCVLDPDEGDGGGWFTVAMNVAPSLEVNGFVNGKALACVTPVAGSNPGNIQYSAGEPLTIGGPNDSGGKNYRGAIASVQLATPAGTPDLPAVLVGRWVFSDEGQFTIRDASPNQQDIKLPSGRWAWVPIDSPVLMPMQITSNNTWRAYYTDGNTWTALNYPNDPDWVYAVDMPTAQDWVSLETPDARWIWAILPYDYVRTVENSSTSVTSSCAVHFVCWCTSSAACSCPSCSYTGYPEAGNVIIGTTIDLPANPVEASARIWADDFCTLFVNGTTAGGCSSYYTPMDDAITLTNLHMDTNNIYIQATNLGGPAGVLVIIDIDFYNTYTVPP